MDNIGSPDVGVAISEQEITHSLQEVEVVRIFHLPSGVQQFAAGICFCTLNQEQEFDDKATRRQRTILGEELARIKTEAKAGRRSKQPAIAEIQALLDADTNVIRTVVSNLRLKRPMVLDMFVYGSGLKLVEKTIESKVADRFPRNGQPAREVFPAGDGRQEAFLNQGIGLTLAVVDGEFVYINAGGALAEDLALACIFRANKGQQVTPRELLKQAGILMSSSEFSPVVVAKGFWGRQKVIDKDAFLLNQREILIKAKSIAAGV
ncbi:hypothetical protein KKD62_02750 [Patescibacteria group bacterium]|nr:hypothetical protein [Patescibacteria group bacterium]MBU1931859.1 hypothetical protein [Patescibacteria group bacterium]